METKLMALQSLLIQILSVSPNKSEGRSGVAEVLLFFL